MAAAAEETSLEKLKQILSNRDSLTRKLDSLVAFVWSRVNSIKNKVTALFPPETPEYILYKSKDPDVVNYISFYKNFISECNANRTMKINIEMHYVRGEAKFILDSRLADIAGVTATAINMNSIPKERYTFIDEDDFNMIVVFSVSWPIQAFPQ